MDFSLIIGKGAFSRTKKNQLYLNIRKIIGSKVQKFGHHLKIGKNANKAKLTLFKLNQFL